MMGHSGDSDATWRSGWPEPEERNHQFSYVLSKAGTARYKDAIHMKDWSSAFISSLYVLSPELVKLIRT